MKGCNCVPKKALNVLLTLTLVFLMMPGIGLTVHADDEDWQDVIVNGGLGSDDTQSFFTKYNGEETPTNSVITGEAYDRVIKITSTDAAGHQPDDTVFFIKSNIPLPAGTKYKIEFSYMASETVNDVETWTYANPDEYIHWDCIGKFYFEPFWQDFSKEGVITDEQSHSDKPCQTVAFLLAVPDHAVDFYFKDIVFKVDMNSIPNSPENITEDSCDVSADYDGKKEMKDAVKEFEAGGYSYTVNDQGNKYVTVTGIKDKKAKSVKVGATVSYQGVVYKITMVGDGAFKKLKKLMKAKVGSNVVMIGANAFEGCDKLKEITINANNLQSIGKRCLKKLKEGAKITIICKNKKTYKRIVKKLKKIGAKDAEFIFKKG